MSIIVEVKGIVFKNEDGTRRQDIIAKLREGDPLFLWDEGSFEYPEAIGVYTEKEEGIGFLSSELAYQIKEITNDFRYFKVRISQIHGSQDHPDSCSIEIDDISWETGEDGDKWLVLDTENERIVSLAESGGNNSMDFYFTINELKQEQEKLKKEYDAIVERMSSKQRGTKKLWN